MFCKKIIFLFAIISLKKNININKILKIKYPNFVFENEKLILLKKDKALVKLSDLKKTHAIVIK